MAIFDSLTRLMSLKRRTVAASHSSHDGESRTGDYTPVHHIYWQRIRDLPAFSLRTVRYMLNDHEVRLALATRAAPLFGVEWGYKEGGQFTPGVQCARPEVGQFVQRQLERIWKNDLHRITDAQAYGWSGGEVVLRLGDSNLIEVSRLEARAAEDIRIALRRGQRIGVQVDRVKNQGKVDLYFPNAFFHAHMPMPGQHYGVSALLGAYSPWADKWFNGGALDVRRLFMHKDAYGGVTMGYPSGVTNIEGVDKPVPNRDIARQIAEQISAGNTITKPSERDEHGNDLWPIERANVPANPQHILEYPKDLDAEIRRGIGVPDGITDDEGAGAWAGNRIKQASFYSTLDTWLIQIVNDLTEQVFRPLVKMNWGQEIDFEICHKPLAEQAMEQQSNAGPGTPGQFPPADGDSQDGGLFGNDDGNGGPPVDPDLPSLDGLEPKRMSAYELIGEGVVSAAEMVQAARSVLKERPTKLSSFEESEHPRGEDGRFIAKGTHADVASLIADTLADPSKGGNEWIDYASVTKEQADRISNSTGIDVTGYIHQMQGSEITHALNRHGKESGGFQISITPEDLEQVPEIIANAESISITGKTKQGHEVIEYRKRSNGHTVVIEEIRTGRKKLAFKTMYKFPSKKKEDA